MLVLCSYQVLYQCVILTLLLVIVYWRTDTYMKSVGIFFRFFIKLLIKQLHVDSMLPCICSVIDHRRCQNVVRTSMTHLANAIILVTFDTILDCKTVAPAFRSNMVRRSRSQKIWLFCSLTPSVIFI